MKEKGMTTINLKKFNRNKVYQYIYQQKETSKLQIVRDLQMGLSTVSQNLNELEQDGLICRNGYFESTGGRKAQIIRIVEDFRISLGLGILKDMFHIVAVNLYGEVMATETIELPYVNSDTYYTSLAENVETFILNRQYEPEKIEVGIIYNPELTGFEIIRHNTPASRRVGTEHCNFFFFIDILHFCACCLGLVRCPFIQSRHSVLAGMLPRKPAPAGNSLPAAGRREGRNPSRCTRSSGTRGIRSEDAPLHSVLPLRKVQ